MNTDDFNVGENNHGIYLNSDPSFLIKALSFDGVLSAAGFSGFSIGATLPNPTDYLGGYFGTYTIASYTTFSMEANNGSSTLNASFIPTGVTISAVPEPSTYALGAIASGVLALAARRRRQAIANH